MDGPTFDDVAVGPPTKSYNRAFRNRATRLKKRLEDERKNEEKKIEKCLPMVLIIFIH